jgi:hypothetical protein
MTKSTYLDQIEFKIAAHQQTVDALLGEIQKLRNAAEVIAQLRGNDGGGPVTLDITPDKKTSGPITIRKIGGPKSREGMRVDKKAIKAIRQAILDFIGRKETVQSADVAESLHLEKKIVWNHLYALKNLGLVIFEDGVYRLPMGQANDSAG